MVEGFDWEAIDGCVPPYIEGLFDVLWDRYGAFIIAGQFSFDDRAWHRLDRFRGDVLSVSLN